MSQSAAWEREYRSPQLVTKDDKPQKDALRFFKFLKKKGLEWDDAAVLDLGCGTGRNANYLAGRGARVAGIDISPTAIDLAKARAKAAGVNTDYRVASIGAPYPFADATFDVVLDITSSNSLNEAERAIYLKETRRVLKPGGYLLVRALCKDGDKNARELLQLYPGTEHDTYVLPDLGVTERVFSREDFIAAYQPYFKILTLEKKATYTRFKGQSYQRRFWIGYLQKVV